MIHMRAGTEDVCRQIQSTWIDERERLVHTWHKLTDPAKRALIADIREKVVSRGRILYGVIAPKGTSTHKKYRVVRKLVEKTSSELFDTSIVYDDLALPLLLDDILKHGGGGEVIPIGLQMEVENAIGDTEEVEQLLQKALNTGGNESTDSMNSHDSKENNDRRSGSVNSMAANRSINSIHSGFYPSGHSTAKMRPGPSRTIQDLTSSMVPFQGLPKPLHVELVLNLLVEFRNAFLVHFAILVFSELFDDQSKVQHKYEYTSDSETDIGAVTDIEDESDGSDPLYS